MLYHIKCGEQAPQAQVTMFHPAIRQYLSQLKQHSEACRASPFWDDQLSAFRSAPVYQRLEALEAEELAAIVRRAGYGLEPLPGDCSQLKEDSQYLEALIASKRITVAAKQLTPKSFEMDKVRWEHARALSFLKSRGLLEAYQNFLSSLMVRSSYQIARHYYYLRQLQQLAEQHLSGKGLSVIEVGAGGGVLACFLLESGLASEYCIVDLPEMLLHSSFTISRQFPAMRIGFNQIPEPAETGCWFFTPDQLAQIPSERFDLCINMFSFMEMERTVVETYLALFYRTARKGSLLFNVNRPKKGFLRLDGKLLDHNPLLYPYNPADEVLLWEVDEFEYGTRARLTQTSEYPRPAFTYAAIL